MLLFSCSHKWTYPFCFLFVLIVISILGNQLIKTSNILSHKKTLFTLTAPWYNPKMLRTLEIVLQWSFILSWNACTRDKSESASSCPCFGGFLWSMYYTRSHMCPILIEWDKIFVFCFCFHFSPTKLFTVLSICWTELSELQNVHLFRLGWFERLSFDIIKS